MNPALISSSPNPLLDPLWERFLPIIITPSSRSNFVLSSRRPTLNFKCSCSSNLSDNDTPKQEMGPRSVKDVLSSMVDERLEELLNSEKNRVLLDRSEEAAKRMEMAKSELAEIEKQEIEAKKMKEYVNQLETRASESGIRADLGPTVMDDSTAKISLQKHEKELKTMESRLDQLQALVERNLEQTKYIGEQITSINQMIQTSNSELSKKMSEVLEAISCSNSQGVMTGEGKGWFSNLHRFSTPSSLWNIAECQKEISEARAMVEEAEHSLAVDGVGGRDALMENESEAIKKNAERLESIKAALISAIVGTLAGSPISLSQVTSNSELILCLAITLISCALYGVTYRYVMRRDLEDIHLKTGVAAAFGIVKGLAILGAGPPLELNGGSLLSHACVGAISVSENLLIFLFATVALDFCIKLKILSPFPVEISV